MKTKDMQGIFDPTFLGMMQKHSLDQVVILAHMNPDGDAAGSVLGLAHYLRDAYPQYAVYPYLSDKLDRGPRRMVDRDALFSPFQEPQVSGRYAVIVCDTATKKRVIGLPWFERAVCSMVIDHHAGNEAYADINLTGISEACAVNLFYLFDRDRLKQAACETHPNAADYLYLGIIQDTECFSRTDESVFEASLELLRMGVSHEEAMVTMHTMTREALDRRSRLLHMAQTAVDGKVAYVILDREQAVREGMNYEDIHAISGILRDCEDVELGFTMYEQEKDVWRCSFRSDGRWIDVNQLLKPLGGGGHAGAAGLKISTGDPKKLLEDVLDRIQKML